MRRSVAILCLLAPALVLAGQVDLGLLDLDGKSVDPFAGQQRATVFLFTLTDCPISNRYAPELRRIHDEFRPQGVEFWLVYPDPGETPDKIREHLRAYDYPFAALRDPRHGLVRRTGAKITPEAAVFDASGRLVYRGRIDDLYVAFGKKRAVPTTRDLHRALEETLAGRAVDPATTEAVGCYIPPLE